MQTVIFEGRWFFHAQNSTEEQTQATVFGWCWKSGIPAVTLVACKEDLLLITG